MTTDRQSHFPNPELRKYKENICGALFVDFCLFLLYIVADLVFKDYAETTFDLNDFDQSANQERMLFLHRCTKSDVCQTASST